MLVDTHAHLTDPAICDHVEEILQRAQQHDIRAIVNVCTHSEALEKGLSLSKRHRWVFQAAAVHPQDAEKSGDLFFPEVARYAREGGIIALGETGLDYYRDLSFKEVQKKLLRKHLDLALETKLPLIFHCREAFSDLFEEVDRKGKEISAVVHCFTGTLEEAKQCLNRGWLISFSGVVTFKNAEAIRGGVRYVPLDRLMVETDTPYLAPQSKRGKVNEPSYMVETARQIADIKEVSIEKLENATTHTAAQFFSFPKQIIDV